MGMETFGLAIRCQADPEAVHRCLAEFAQILRRKPTLWGGSYWEVNGPDYIIEIEVLSSDETRVSIRCAVCCAIEGVDRMVDCARRISSASGTTVWRELGQRTEINVADPSADEVARAIFLKRRQAFLRAYGLQDVPAAGVRSDQECFDYIGGFQSPRES